MSVQPETDLWLVGMDGCRAGWVAALIQPTGNDVRIRVMPRFADIAKAPEKPAVIAVDIPVGLPDHTGPGGRDAENAIRPLLGARQSSVFSVPSRAALEATDYRDACGIALSTSDPPRKISRQLFMIAPKIREVDASLRNDVGLAKRVFEVHPEAAFWRLNGECALPEPKKIRGKAYEPGLRLRRKLLVAAGLPRDVVEAASPPGAAADDLLDALACAAIARRIHSGIARPHPNPPPRDSYGLPMAIWT